MNMPIRPGFHPASLTPGRPEPAAQPKPRPMQAPQPGYGPPARPPRQSLGGTAPRQRFEAQPQQHYAMPGAGHYGRYQAPQPPPLPYVRPEPPPLPYVRPEPPPLPYVRPEPPPLPYVRPEPPPLPYVRPEPPPLPYVRPEPQRHNLPPPPPQGRPELPPLPYVPRPPQRHTWPPMQDHGRPPSPSHAPPPGQHYAPMRPPVQQQGRPYAQSQWQPQNFHGGRPVAAASTSHRPTQVAGSNRPPSSGLHVNAPQGLPAAAPSGMTEIRDEYKFKDEAKLINQRLNAMNKPSSFFNPLSKDDKKYNKQIQSAVFVNKEHMDGNKNFVINIDGKPAGLMSTSMTDQGVKIHGLTALPNTKGVGFHAIAQAAQMSNRANHGGNVYLEFLDGDTRAYYAKLGFEKNGDASDNKMYLPPDKAQALIQASAAKQPRFK